MESVCADTPWYCSIDGSELKKAGSLRKLSR
jgi:hypothetical protein